MRKARRAIKFLVALLWFAAAATSALAQTGPNDACAAERAKAAALAKEQSWLEALPLFEDLAKKNPNDAGVLEGLAQCLIAHSATLPDENEAGKDRLRARGLLESAQKLGDHSQMLENLLDTLKALPPKGEMVFATKQ
jgi:hypothetical protein